ncbi:LuxR C-terminal-related transcriptional regulator [Actinokineospora sp. UTMC 2448]|uniref:LuxR C-terminal-related transcriptional regulator n=1 Tax=Actinokineospora sp. UTMC 2448 TaxID=2268449 RepID=UPI0021641C74|nr:LuxR C-terminal-related transcriptional regulator [Actinokineospora sp. UTMC 2448]UVS79171.1 Regulatory protein AfsR [Actinokineospora sp. UTMC 2448]
MDVPRATTGYVGRRRESSAVRAALRPGCLVTLTGPGGVGKTRLATAVASQACREFADGVVFVDLTELGDGALLPDLVATRLGLHNRMGQPDAVVTALRERALLLVLDNCEHVVAAAAAFAAAVLAACPRVAILATSRQTLGAAGEQVLRVPPLAVPADDVAASPDALLRYDAVALLVQRACAVLPDFELTAENSAAVLDICRHLDGLPLAIELAAARLRSLSPHQIADRLTRRLPALAAAPRTAPERQRTLRATIDWSFALCSPAEQTLWLRASVFAGSFDLSAAERVCAGPDLPADDVLDTVEGLIDKSVLIREDHGDIVRYRMLETLREHGRELLDASGDRARVRRLHRDWIDELTAAADANWAGNEQVGWITRLRREQANLRAALDWSISEPGEAGAALRIASRLDEYWMFFGHSVECRQWLERALAATPDDHPDRPRALAVCALHAVWHLDLDAAELLLADAEPAAADDELFGAFLTYVRALAAQIRTDTRAADLAGEAAAVFRAHGDVRRELHPLWIHGVSTGYRKGDVAEGRRSLRRMLDLCVSHGETRYRAMAQFGLAYLEVERGDVLVAEDLARQSLRSLVGIGEGSGTAYLLDALAWIADRKGEHERAAVLFGAAARVWAAIGSAPEIAVSGPHRAHKADTMAALGAERFARAHAEGRAMGADEVARFALGETEPPTDAWPGVLTRRQWEIAGLVAAGMSNRHIATRLVISQRTADTHVQNILNKLGLHNRAQIAVWFTETANAQSTADQKPQRWAAGKSATRPGVGGA